MSTETWPEIFEYRSPRESDADEWGDVLVLIPGRGWVSDQWNLHLDAGRSWAHTPSWRPGGPSKRELALDALKRLQEWGELINGAGATDAVHTIREALADNNT